MMEWSGKPLLEGNMRKIRIVCLLTVLAFLCCLAVPAKIAAESVQSEGQQEYHLSEDGTALIKYNGSASFVSVPDGVRVIRGGAFAGNRNIATVYLPDSVVEIEGGAFENCANLQNVITSGNSKLSSIGANAFAGCPLLNTSFAFDVGSGVDSGAFYQKPAAPATAKPAQPTPRPTSRPDSHAPVKATQTPVPVIGDSVYSDFWIIQQPESIRAAEGDYVSFTVWAVSSNDIQYQWQKSTDGEDWEDINSQSSTFHNVNTNTLSFYASPGSAKWMFRCVVINGERALLSSVASLWLQNAESGSSDGTEDRPFGAPYAVGAWQQTDTAVLIIWNPVELATGYELYRIVNGGSPELIKTLADYSYLDTGLDLPNNRYSYAVAAIIRYPDTGETLRSELSAVAETEIIPGVQDGIELNGVAYTFTPDGAVVTAYKGNASSLVIPASVQKGNLTYTVVGIGPNVFRGNKTLKTISLPNTIRVIETGAFAYCNAMIDH